MLSKASDLLLFIWLLLLITCDLAITKSTDELLVDILESLTPTHKHNYANGISTDEWVVRVTGGLSEADRIANELGFDNFGLVRWNVCESNLLVLNICVKVRGFEDIYVFRQQQHHSSRTKRSGQHYSKRLSKDKRVSPRQKFNRTWMSQVLLAKRVSRFYGLSNKSSNKGRSETIEESWNLPLLMRCSTIHCGHGNGLWYSADCLEKRGKEIN